MSTKDPQALAAEAAALAASLEKLGADLENLSAKQENLLVQQGAQLEQYKQQAAQLENIIATKSRELAVEREKAVVDTAAQARLEQSIQTAKAQAAAYQANQASIDAALQKTQAKRKEIRNENVNQAIKDSKMNMDHIREQTNAQLNLSQVALESGRGMAEGMGATVQGFSKEMAAMAFLFPGKAQSVVQDLKDDYGHMQTEIKKVGKETGIVGAGFEKLQVMSADTDWARRMMPQEAIDQMNKMGGTIDNTGLRIADTSPTFQAMHDNIQIMRSSFMEANQGIAVVSANLFANMKKVGVPLESSTKSFDNMNKVIRQTPMDSAKSVKSLLSVADTLEISAARAFKDFNDNIGTMSQYGEGAIDVFSRLEAQSINTGLGVNRLTEYASGLDTFEGAAKVAQQFNAVMGDTFLSTTDLVNADHDEKILMIQQAMEESGVSFETADRRMKQVITSALGLNDTAEAARLLSGGTAADYEIKAKQVSTEAKSNEDIQAQVNQTLTMQEQLTKSSTAMQGGMYKFNERALEFGEKGAKIVLGTFKQVLGVAKDSEAAALGTVAAFDLIITGGTGIAESLAKGNLTEAVGKVITGGAVIGGASLIPEATDAMGLHPGGGPTTTGPRPMGLAERARLEAERSQGATGESGLADQILQLTNAIREGSLLQADITTNVQLDGKTIDTITQRTSAQAVANVKENMTRTARGLPPEQVPA